MTVADVLMILWSGAAMTLFGVLIGGVLVFRTKRDSHETIFAPKQPKAEGPVNIDELNVEEEVDIVPDMFGAKNREFLSQLAAEKRIEQ